MTTTQDLQAKTMADQITFDEWAIDVTCAKQIGTIAFVPICGDEVVWGYTVIRDRAPGRLVGVVSQDGMGDVDEWVANNPLWKVDYSSGEDFH